MKPSPTHSTTSYAWPKLPHHAAPPVWTGRGFRVGQDRADVLAYAVGDSGWTDDLTSFHEENAGDDHCIDRASRRHALVQLSKHVTAAEPVLLEVGCSSGFFLDVLRPAFPHATVIGADYVRGPLETLAQKRDDIPLLQFDLTRCPLPSNSIDGVVLLNVLEHIEDHAAAARQVARILKPGGVAVIEVPAGPHLYDVYDKVLLHHRRYELSGVRDLMTEAGLEVRFASYLGALVYPAFWWVKRRNRQYLTAPQEVQQQIVAQAVRKTGRSRVMSAVFWLEDRVRSWLPLPFGIRCVATCVKKPDAAAPSKSGSRSYHQAEAA